MIVPRRLEPATVRVAALDPERGVLLLRRAPVYGEPFWCLPGRVREEGAGARECAQACLAELGLEGQAEKATLRRTVTITTPDGLVRQEETIVRATVTGGRAGEGRWWDVAGPAPGVVYPGWSEAIGQGEDRFR
ncbi:NUDIX hydrolase [Nonomuraea sediminis]|uniref:NUDIX hydrolase n=1 Tax=Nonomuraea sediminis TaxID=2835864 RepID=UPI001BDBB78D|nr:NUDIX domain-containing protein [Nonomuraea sediminis]